MRFTLAVALFCACLTAGAGAATPGEIEVGGRLRDVPMYGINGRVQTFAAYRGKPLVINVWASWCGPCRAEMGSLERLSRLDQKRQFRVIGVSTDDDAIAAQTFVVRARLSFDNFVDHNLVLENMLGANTIPLTVLVDADGRVVQKIRGSRDWTSRASIELIERAFRLRVAY